MNILKNNSHREKRCFVSKNKCFFISVALILILSINLTSAFEFDNIKKFEKGDLEYGKIEIKNSFGLGETIEELTLIENTDTCGEKCYAKLEIEIFEFGRLIDDIKFIDVNTGEEKEIEHKLYLIDEYGKRDYDATNGRLSISGVSAGKHILFIEGTKEKLSSIDWIIETKGVVLNEWALWSANITLNFPDNDSILNNEIVNFGCSAVTNTSILNASLWTNTTGTWALNETKTSDISFCYQESANTTNQTGIDGDCGLNYSGSYYVINDGTSDGYFYINYTKPNTNGSIIGVEWLSKHGNLSEYNSTISNSCLNYDSNKLILRFYSNDSFPYYYSYGQCFNGSWNNITQIVSIFNNSGGLINFLDIDNLYDGNFSSYSAYDSGSKKWFNLTSDSREGRRIYEEALYWEINEQLETNELVCYQESANTTNQAGTDGNCGLSYNGNYDITYPYFDNNSLTYDGNYNTEALSLSTSSNFTNYYVNYTKPNDVNSAVWQTKTRLGAGDLFLNTTINESCMNVNENISLKLIFIHSPSFADWVEFYCYNGSSWQSLRPSGTTITSSDRLYEEGIYWNVSYLFTKNISDGDYIYNCEFCDTENCAFSASNYSFTVDTSAPTINITSPTPIINYGKEGLTLNLNWSILNGALSSCWYNYNNTNTSVNCLDNHTTFNITDQKNLTFYANDTAGNLGINFTTWDYKIFEINQTFVNETIEGTFETFKLYLEKGSGVNVQSVVLHYNGQNKTSSLFSSGSNVTAEAVLSIPSVSTDTNETFYFTITLSDSTIINTTNQSQLVRNIDLDDCSSQPNLFLTINLVDEENQSAINGTIEVYIEIINPENYQEILTINNTYSSVSSKNFCSNIVLNDTSLLLNAEIRYDSENHSAEFYNIQRSELQNYPKNYTLYDLKDEDTTKFKLIYIGDNLVGVEEAIIQLQRKYISEGVYKIVEAPLTSSDSTAVVHVDTNTNSYKATVVKDGELLGIFDNLVFICQSELTGECTLDLQDYITPPNSISIETIQDFSYTISSSLDDKLITVDYSVPSGTTSEVKVISTQKDIIGEETICNTTVSSAGGSIECEYEDKIEDSYINYEIYKDGVQIAQKSYVVNDDLREDFGGDNYFILIVFTISLIFMALLSPEWIVMNSVISILIGGAIWLVRGMDFVLGIGSIVWLLLGAIIIIIKMAQKEDQ